MKPTDEQKQWLWEQCGFVWKLAYHDFYELESPLKEQFALTASSIGDIKYYPPIDLNNLFQYAVPKLDLEQIILQPETDGSWYCGVVVHSDLFEAEDKDPALALFWAIYKALGGKE